MFSPNKGRRNREVTVSNEKMSCVCVAKMCPDSVEEVVLANSYCSLSTVVEGRGASYRGSSVFWSAKPGLLLTHQAFRENLGDSPFLR